jgi:hypothetical protein
MKTGFKDPIEDKKNKVQKSPWDFSQPPYDERSSCYVNAGTHHGVGHKQPVGHAGNPKSKVAILPEGRIKTMQVAKVPTKNLDTEIEQ